MLSAHAEKGGYLRNATLLTKDGSVYRVASYVIRKQSFWSRPKTPFGRGVQLDEIRVELVTRSLEDVKRDVSTALTAMSELLSEELISEQVLRSGVTAASDPAALFRCLLEAFAVDGSSRRG